MKRKSAYLYQIEEIKTNQASVRRNAVESPLLRLPPEIRNRIFRYAMGGSVILVQSHHPAFSSDTWRNTTASAWHGRATHLSADRQHNQGTAFHLPETCRQIYAETATLGYATNTFVCHPRPIDLGILRLETPRWYLERRAAQMSAITSIQAFDYDVWEYLLCNESWTFRSRFPGLEEVFIPSWPRTIRVGRDLESQHKHIRARINEKEGAGLRVVFAPAYGKRSVSVRRRS